jgi:hypothetical protein
MNFSSAFPGPRAPHSRTRPTSPLTHLYTPSTKEEENYPVGSDDTRGSFRRVIVKHCRELNHRSDTAYCNMACGVCRNKKVKCKLPSILPFPRDAANPYVQFTPTILYKANMFSFRRPRKARLRILQSKSPVYVSLPPPFLSFSLSKLVLLTPFKFTRCTSKAH